jgi:large subunit ribosomal protein L43
MWHTDVPSIQGAWTPFTPKNPLHNLVVYPSEELSKPLAEEKSATERLIELFEQQKLEQSSLELKRAE